MENNNENLRRSSRIKTRINYNNIENELSTLKSNKQEAGSQGKCKKIKDSSDNSIITPKPTAESRGGRGRQRKANTSDVNKKLKHNIFMHELEMELENIQEEKQKPSELFHDKDDISGNRIYGFQTPSKKNAMVEKALLSCTPSTSKIISTPKSKTLRVVIKKIDTISTTPTSGIRKSARIQQAIETRKRFVHFSSESESVSEDSEFVPSCSEESDIGMENENISDEENTTNINETPRKNKNLQLKRIQIPITPCRRSKSKNIAYHDYHLKTDEYFETQAEKVLTSDHTLGRLKNPRIDERKLQELLSNENHISTEHKKGLRALTENCKSMFPMWHYIMEEGYSLLLHGLGSKKYLIDDFHKEVIFDHPTVIINGFFPSLTIKDILDGIIELLDSNCPTNINECFNIIEDSLNQNPDDRLYLLIHNIDGIMLRSNKAQDVLSRLAAIKNIRILASVDHINAPIIWDSVKRSRFNFYWWDATTLLPYAAETSYESSLLVQCDGALALSSLNNVFASLTTNAKAIYTILVKYQLENVKSNFYSGMAFKDLYRGAREAFLVSSDIALRAQLTEFIDHKLVRTKRNIDGAEYLIIPVDNSLLKKFLDDQEGIP